VCARKDVILLRRHGTSAFLFLLSCGSWHRPFVDGIPCDLCVSRLLLHISDRCHKKGIAGKLDLAMQWAEEQEEAGGEVNFKEGLAFYSSIGILQV